MNGLPHHVFIKWNINDLTLYVTVYMYLYHLRSVSSKQMCTCKVYLFQENVMKFSLTIYTTYM